MQKEEKKFVDSCVFEGMTSIRAIIKNGYSANNNRKIKEILFDEARISKIGKEIGYLRAISEEKGFTVRGVSAPDLNKITLGNSHGGIVAVCTERAIPCLDENTMLPEKGFYCLIQGIEDPYNFGYSLRSLYACGVNGIILPERNWMSAAGVVARSSAGSSELLDMFTCDPLLSVKIFKANGYSVVCADERTDNILGKCDLRKPILLIVGGEKRGISREIVNEADILVKIEYAREFKASLSAASASTMFAYEIMRQDQ